MSWIELWRRRRVPCFRWKSPTTYHRSQLLEVTSFCRRVFHAFFVGAVQSDFLAWEKGRNLSIYHLKSRFLCICIFIYMSSRKYLVHQAIGGVFLPRSPVPYGFWRPDLVLHSHIISCLSAVFPFDWLACGLAGWAWPANLTGWLLAGWLVGWWLAGWLAGLGWLGLAGLLTSLAGRLLAGWLYILYGWLVFDGCGLPDLWAWIWPRSDLVLTSFWTSYWTSYNLHLLIGYINDEEDKVPTSY